MIEPGTNNHVASVDAGTVFDLEYAESESSLSAFTDLHFRITSDGTYVRVWALDPSLLLVPPDQIVGANIADFFSPVMTSRMLDAIRQTIDTSEVTAIEYSQVEGDETTFFEARIARLSSDEVMAVVRDVSSLKVLEQQLVHAESMRFLGRLAGGIAHDFNNVLHVIRGHTQALVRRRDDGHEIDDRLEAITRAVDRTSSLVERLMILTRPTPNNPTPTTVDAFLRSLGPALTQLLGETIELEFVLGAQDCAVAIDDSRFENVLLNLATNALDAMPRGGALRITTAQESEGWICIAVSDTGDGIDPDNLSMVFEPFFTTKAPGIGTGLGLSTTHDSIADAGGSITVDSKVGSGTTFTILLPTTEDKSLDIETKVRTLSRHNDATILVVEDEPDVLGLCVEKLKEFGYTVVGVRDASEALSVIDSEQVVDLLLTDVVMPVMSGPELAREINTSRGNVPALFMTGYAHGSDLDGRGIEAKDILRKPFTEAELAVAVSEHLAAASEGIQ